jgi:hypothetical protein
MKFKTVILGFLIVIAGLSSACSFKPGPEDTVGNFCKSMKEFDTAGMLNCRAMSPETLPAEAGKSMPSLRSSPMMQKSTTVPGKRSWHSLLNMMPWRLAA